MISWDEMMLMILRLPAMVAKGISDLGLCGGTEWTWKVKRM